MTISSVYDYFPWIRIRLIQKADKLSTNTGAHTQSTCLWVLRKILVDFVIMMRRRRRIDRGQEIVREVTNEMQRQQKKRNTYLLGGNHDKYQYLMVSGVQRCGRPIFHNVISFIRLSLSVCVSLCWNLWFFCSFLCFCFFQCVWVCASISPRAMCILVFCVTFFFALSLSLYAPFFIFREVIEQSTSPRRYGRGAKEHPN